MQCRNADITHPQVEIARFQYNDRHGKELSFDVLDALDQAHQKASQQGEFLGNRFTAAKAKQVQAKHEVMTEETLQQMESELGQAHEAATKLKVGSCVCWTRWSNAFLSRLPMQFTATTCT